MSPKIIRNNLQMNKHNHDRVLLTTSYKRPWCSHTELPSPVICSWWRWTGWRILNGCIASWGNIAASEHFPQHCVISLRNIILNRFFCLEPGLECYHTEYRWGHIPYTDTTLQFYSLLHYKFESTPLYHFSLLFLLQEKCRIMKYPSCLCGSLSVCSPFPTF
jgi:hypothetical protein